MISKGAQVAELQQNEVHKIDQLLQVQSGAVVSRTVINQKNGTITLFAFDAGEGLSEHAAPYNAYAQVIEGKLDVTISGKPFSLTNGEIIIMPANQPHALKAESAVKMLLVMIRS